LLKLESSQLGEGLVLAGLEGQKRKFPY